jgi:hypothetical protein
MSRNERANRHDDDSSDYDEEAEYIKANKELDRDNKWYDARNRELESQVKSLKREISVLKSNSDRKTKRQLRIDYAWDGEEANLSDKVSNWTKAYLFARYKFLKDGWMEYSNDDKSLSSFVRRKMKMDEVEDFQGAWERVICPTIQNKYVTIRCNLNNEVRKAYKGE